MSHTDYVAWAAFLLGALLGWGCFGVVLQLAYRLGVVRYIGATTGKEPGK